MASYLLPVKPDCDSCCSGVPGDKAAVAGVTASKTGLVSHASDFHLAQNHHLSRRTLTKSGEIKTGYLGVGNSRLFKAESFAHAILLFASG